MIGIITVSPMGLTGSPKDFSAVGLLLDRWNGLACLKDKLLPLRLDNAQELQESQNHQQRPSHEGVENRQ